MPYYKTPIASQIDAALLRMRSPEFAAYFLSRLENPLWIQPLKDRGVFASPPLAITVEGGGIRYPHWPASKYLAKMAGKAPLEVAAIFGKRSVVYTFAPTDVTVMLFGHEQATTVQATVA